MPSDGRETEREMILARRNVRSKFDVIRWKVIKLYLKACVWGGLSWKGQSSARSSRLCKVRGRVRPLWVLCTQPFSAFLQEAISMTWTHDLKVTRQQLYSCTKAPLHIKKASHIVNKIILDIKKGARLWCMAGASGLRGPECQCVVVFLLCHGWLSCVSTVIKVVCTGPLEPSFSSS
jgi:hypothetical protein